VTISAGLVPFAAPAAHAEATVTVTTYSGADRYGTSAAIAEAKFPNGVPGGHVILASGGNFPDALAANYLAGQLDAPVLLTPATASDPDFPETTAALAKLLIGSTKDITIVGGTAAVGADVMTALQGDGYTVNQIGGATRFDTAQLIDTQSGETPGPGVSGNATAIIATGDNFPDALAAGPLAWDKHFPVILTDGSLTTLSPEAQATLSTDAIKNVLIMGGSAAINPGINAQLTSLGITIDKQFAGADRTDTAGQFEAYITSTYGFSTGSVILASGGNYPDALSAGALGGDPQGILLTEPDLTLGTYTTAEMNALAATASALVVVGGSAAVPTATVTAAQAALEKTVATQTSLPQLVSSSIVSTTSASQANSANAKGTVVEYVFNQALNGALYPPEDFYVYPSADDYVGATPHTSGFPGDGICGVSAACAYATNPDAINVLFDPADGAAGSDTFPLESTTGTDSSGQLTLATIVTGATTNTSGQLSPASSVGIGAASTVAPEAGVTAAPDLESIGTPRAAATTDALDTFIAGCAAGECSAIDLTFDKAAYPQAAGVGEEDASYDIVYAAPASGISPTASPETATALGQEVACVGPQLADPNNGGTGYTVPGYNTSTDTVTIVCPNEPGSPASTLTTANVGRIIVQTGAGEGVGTAASTSGSDVPNGFLEASKAPHAIAFPTPSLASLTLTPGTSATAPDVALFTFDTGIVGCTDGAGCNNAGGANAITATGFSLVTEGGTAVPFQGPAACQVATPATPSSTATEACQVTGGPTTLEVALYFEPGTLGGVGAVGGSVAAGSVYTSNAPNIGNGDDELGAADSAATSVAPGSIDAPQLTSATVGSTTNGLGQTIYAPAWTFNQAVCLNTTPCPTVTAVGQPLDEAAFHLYDADGTELTCQAGTIGVGVGTGDNTVGCGNMVQGNSPTGATSATAAQLAAVALATVDFNGVAGDTATGINNEAASDNPNPEGAVSA
jgi:putative cell wall-binding protein